MIEINTAEDIKLIKEFAKAFSSDINVEDIVREFNKSESIKELKASNDALAQQVGVLFESQKTLLKVLDKILEHLEKNHKKVEKKKTSRQEEIKEAVKPKKQRKARNGDLPFEPYVNEKKEYQSVLLEGINLIHVFTANEKNGTQKHLLPVNLFELLIIAEAFSKGNRSITNTEVKKLCELFGVTRPQFSKIYYNLAIGKFNNILGEVESMINNSTFTLKKSHVYRNDHDTGLDKQEFYDLLNIYANDNNSFMSIYKLVKEKNDIDPFDLLISLKKSHHVSKIWG